MDHDSSFDMDKVHRHFSADCFNKAWELIEKPNRSAEEDEQMLCLSQASLWHWTQRNDCGSANMAIGYWQASRIHAILGRPGEARRYARLCLDRSRGEAAFLLAYAFEALARAEKIDGNDAKAKEYCVEAESLAAAVADAEDRKLLLTDLKTLNS